MTKVITDAACEVTSNVIVDSCERSMKGPTLPFVSKFSQLVVMEPYAPANPLPVFATSRLVTVLISGVVALVPFVA